MTEGVLRMTEGVLRMTGGALRMTGDARSVPGMTQGHNEKRDREKTVSFLLSEDTQI